MGKVIQITSLNMRFYARDGWNLDLLLSYLKQGRFAEMDPARNKYWILEPGSRFDCEGLIKDGHVGDLAGRDYYGELKGKTVLEVLEDRSWN